MSDTAFRNIMMLLGLCFTGLISLVVTMIYFDHHKDQWPLAETKRQEIEKIFYDKTSYSVFSLGANNELTDKVWSKEDVRILATLKPNERPYAHVKVYSHPWPSSGNKGFEKLVLYVRDADDIAGMTHHEDRKN